MPTVYVRNKIDGEIKPVELRVRTILIPEGEETEWEDSDKKAYQDYLAAPVVYKPGFLIKHGKDTNAER